MQFIVSCAVFYDAYADKKSKDKVNADFPIMFPCFRISCAVLFVSTVQFCGACLLNILFQNRFFGNNYCGSRMPNGVWAV